MDIKYILRQAIGGQLTVGQSNNVQFVAQAVQDAKTVGLHHPHRLCHFLAQVMHESANLKYFREVWGPTLAQVGYEGRADLGNTEPGDGEKFMGRGPLQITGRYNYLQFTVWARTNVDDRAPDFTYEPELLEGHWGVVAAFWYWKTRDINTLADRNDIELITRRINGGLNGLEHRIECYDRIALAMLGYDYTFTDVRQFQLAHALAADGLVGPRTRAGLHKQLASFASSDKDVRVDNAPVLAERRTPVAPKQLDKPMSRTGGFWERITTMVLGAGGMGVANFLHDWRVVLSVGAAVVLVGAIGLWQHRRIVAAVRDLKQELGR